MIFLSPFQGFIFHRIINGGSRPRLCSVVSSRLLLSPYELFFVRNTVGEGAKGREEKFSPDTNKKKSYYFIKQTTQSISIPYRERVRLLIHV